MAILYKMQVLIFGATCSPCCAQYVKNQNALNATNRKKAVIKAIQENHYVVDFVVSFDNEKDAYEISSEVKNVHKLANFDLRGFVSNSSNIQNTLKGSDSSPDITIPPSVKLDSSSVDKILGMFWDSGKDAFLFDIKINRVDKEMKQGIKVPNKTQCTTRLVCWLIL